MAGMPPRKNFQLARIFGQAAPFSFFQPLPIRVFLPVLALQNLVESQGLLADGQALLDMVAQLRCRVNQAQGADRLREELLLALAGLGALRKASSLTRNPTII